MYTVGEVVNGAATRKTSMEVSQNIKNRIPCDLAIPHLSIYPKGLKLVSVRDICIPMFIAALFTITTSWKEPKSLSRDEWIKKM